MGGLTNPFSASFYEARVRRFMVAITYNYVIVSSYFYAAHASSVRPCTPPKFIFFFLFLALSISLSAHSTAVPFVLFLSAGTEEPSWSKGKPFSVEISWFFLCEACSVSGSGEKLREKAEHPRKTLSEQRKLFQFLNYGWWTESAFST